MRNDKIENGRSVVPAGYRTAPGIDRGDKSGHPLLLALISYGRCRQVAALLEPSDDDSVTPRMRLTTATEAAEAADTLEAGPDQLANYILALGH